MKWYKPLLYILLIFAKIFLSLILMTQAITLTLLAPFGNFYDKAFIGFHIQNKEIADAFKKELSKDKIAKRNKKWKKKKILPNN